MRQLANMDIRNRLKAAKLRQWELAEQLQIDESQLSRWLRHELEGEKLARVTRAIAALEAEQKQ